MLCEKSVLVVEGLDSSELRNASGATGARIVESPLDIEESDLGQCGSASWERKPASNEVEDVIRIEDAQTHQL